MKRGRERKDVKTSQHVAPLPHFPLNLFAVDLGLFTVFQEEMDLISADR